MRGKATDEYSMDKIVSEGILRAISSTIERDGIAVDEKVSAIRHLIDAYDEYYQTGRK